MNDSTSISPTRKRRIRIFFIVLFPFLFIQFWFVMNVEEPYPAILMPMFGSVDGDGSVFKTVETDIRYIYPDTVVSLDMKTFFFDMTESYRFHVMRRLMGPEADPRVYQDEGFREWLSLRGQLLTGRKNANQFEVIWTNVEFDTGKNPVQESRSTMGTFNYRF